MSIPEIPTFIVVFVTRDTLPNYLAHLQQAKHKSQAKVPELVPKQDLVCVVCFVQFKNHVRYRKHLVKTHKVQLKI